MTRSNVPASRYAEPLWRSLRQINRSAIPKKFYPWLVDTGSLTARVIDHCRANFQVQLLSQTKTRPLRGEAMALGMRPSSRALVRQVRLQCATTPWVYARTIIPPQTLARKFHRFTRLGARSLGAMLFADPSMQRSEMQLTQLTSADELYQLITRDLSHKPESIWGRRSLFRLNGKPLLVCEFFLPDIPDFVK
ncbi:MAG: chorismate lyase [Gammaproteobacteria bacterium]|nr:chorismate lyase [Gammaproteobacteria bacterium]